MSTKTAATTSAFGRTPSIASTVAPPYTPLSGGSPPHDPTHLDVELGSLNASGRTSPASIADEDAPPPAYTAGSAFVPTLQLQIQTPGKSWLSFPLPPRPDPIPIYAVSATTGHVDTDAGPAYTSIRFKRGSGNCILVAGEDPLQRPLSTTTYRFGPNRPARVSLYDPLAALTDPNEGRFGSSSVPVSGSDGASAHSGEDQEDEDDASWDAFALEPKGLLTRAVGLKTRLGGFEWRYSSRAERKAIGASSLLVLDRVTRVSTAGGKEEEARTPVARFVRNEELRSPGSGPSTAGNGGRLMLDLRQWDEGAKTDRKMVEILAVTTAVSMLKKEVDRRRAQQIAIMAGAASGGP